MRLPRWRGRGRKICIKCRTLPNGKQKGIRFCSQAPISFGMYGEYFLSLSSALMRAPSEVQMISAEIKSSCTVGFGTICRAPSEGHQDGTVRSAPVEKLGAEETTIPLCILSQKGRFHSSHRWDRMTPLGVSCHFSLAKSPFDWWRA